MTSPPRRLTHPPTAEVAAAQAEHDRMARNRASPWRPSMRDDAPAEDPLARKAFVLAQMAVRINQARQHLQDARQAVLTTSGKAAKQAARNTVKLASRELSEAEAALVRENRGEQLAPAVQRGEIASDDAVLRHPRMIVGRTRQVELQPALERLYRREHITLTEYRAARRYREAWEMAGKNAYPIGLREDAGRSTPVSGNHRIENGIGSNVVLDGARRAIGVFGTGLLEHLVIEGLTLGSWAERRGCTPAEAAGAFRMVMTRLAEHWRDERRAEKPLDSSN